MSKAEQLALQLVEDIKWFPQATKLEREAAALLRQQDALLRDALYALDYAAGMSGCDCPICTTKQKLQEHLNEQDS